MSSDVLSPASEAADHQLTYHDLEHTPEDGRRYELIDGVIHVSPFPSYPHQRALARLFAPLDVHVRAHRLGEVLPSGLMVVLDDPTGVGPDLVFISSERMQLMRREGFFGAPDLVVEVLSSKPYLDSFVKKQKFESAGIPHFWIVDPEAKQLSAYRLEAGRYRLAFEARGEAHFEPELFPGLRIDLGELWI